VLELHQFHAAAKTVRDFALEVWAAQLEEPSGGCANVSWQGLAGTLVETERVVQEEFR
jgi:hypothetical protein